MPATLVWGKGFEFQKTVLSTDHIIDELFGIDGGSLGISWSSVYAMIGLAAKHGVPEEMWPVYPDCELDRDVPLDDVRIKSARLRLMIQKVPIDVAEQDYWLSRILHILLDGHSFYIMI